MESICRTCLNNSDHLLSLFSEDDSKLPFKINIIASIKMVPNDNLPKHICAECVVNVNLLYTFRKVIINSNEQLRRCYKNNIQNSKRKQDGDRIDVRKCELTEDSSSYNSSNPFGVDEVIRKNDKAEENCDLDDVKIPCNNALLVDDNDNLNAINKDKVPVDVNNKKEMKNTNTRGIKLNGLNGMDKRIISYKCDKCNLVTTIRRKYQRHMLNHETKMCNICGKLITSSNLTKHVALHTASPVQCEECGKVCKNFDSLRGHSILHKGVNRTCKICGEWYKERGAYLAHIKLHRAHEDRSVRCPVCDKRLYGKKGLSKHLRAHTGERPYPCEFCKKGFSSSNALNTHRRQHTNERPYKCNLCPMAFPQKVSLRTHLKSKHPNATDDTYLATEGGK